VRNVDAHPDTPLLWALRDHVGLTGTKYGCGVAACGACTVHIDGEPVRSCDMPLLAVSATAKIVTIKGLSPDSTHPIQKA
jgi:isoquinoline 1-oxidoreductase alpha subunit